MTMPQGWIDPNDLDAWNNKGKALLGLEKFDEAIKCYDKAIQIKSDNADAYYGKGAAYSALEKYDEALRYYDKAIEIKPDYTAAWRQKRRCL